MSRAEVEHQAFLEFTSNPMTIKEMKVFTNVVYKNLEFELEKARKKQQNDIEHYIKWIQKKAAINYYLAPFSDGAIALFSRQLHSMVAVRYCFTITSETKKALGNRYSNAIEIVSLHSKKKGEGKKIIKELKDLAKDINLPLVLYAESSSLVNYYEQFSFVNIGRAGANEEFLMIYIP